MEDIEFKVVNGDDEVVEWVEGKHRRYRIVDKKKCDEGKTVIKDKKDALALVKFLNEQYPDSEWQLIRVGIDEYTNIFNL
jgi:hypothetical protein